MYFSLFWMKTSFRRKKKIYKRLNSLLFCNCLRKKRAFIISIRDSCIREHRFHLWISAWKWSSEAYQIYSNQVSKHCVLHAAQDTVGRGKGQICGGNIHWELTKAFSEKSFLYVKCSYGFPWLIFCFFFHLIKLPRGLARHSYGISPTHTNRVFLVNTLPQAKDKVHNAFWLCHLLKNSLGFSFSNASPSLVLYN